MASFAPAPTVMHGTKMVCWLTIFSAMDEVGATARAVGGMHSICLLGDLWLAVGR